jgi:hypothetical protein
MREIGRTDLGSRLSCIQRGTARPEFSQESGIGRHGSESEDTFRVFIFYLHELIPIKWGWYARLGGTMTSSIDRKYTPLTPFRRNETDLKFSRCLLDQVISFLRFKAE